MAETVQEQLDEIFRDHRIVLFMNGTMEAPRDAESAMARDILTAYGLDFHPVDVSGRPAIAAEVVALSGMPSMAQLFIDRGFIVDSAMLPGTAQSQALDKILAQKKVEFDAETAQQMRGMNQ
jgi:monothiol glutaredoxin